VSQLDVGGMEKLLVEFARHADRQRFTLNVVTLGGRGPLADDITACGWPVTALEEPAGLRPGLVFRLARIFRQCGATVVHTHNTKPVMYGSLAARLARVPVVVHTRHGQRFQASWHTTAVFRLATSLVDRVVCVSHDSERLSASEGLAARRLCTIWNGIDVSRFAYRVPRAGGPAVMVGRISPEKDVATLLHAVAQALKEQPAFRLHIAGDGACVPDLKRLAAELGLGEQVVFLGQVRDVPALLAEASLFVLPSLTEGISLTLLEAMARGLPVVTTRVGGNPEIVVEGETGLLVPVQAPTELARAMLSLHNDPERSRRMGLAGRRRVEVHFDVRRMVRDYETLYEQLRQRRHHRTAQSRLAARFCERGDDPNAALAKASG
jgi:glycosyltransferase involved in cell wall biosynthesis